MKMSDLRDPLKQKIVLRRLSSMRWLCWMQENPVKEEYPLEEPDPVEEEICYHLAGPPKVCSKCIRAFPTEEFPTHDCKDINADKYPCKICPRKFRYKSLLVVHLKTHLRLHKGESIPELERVKPAKTNNRRILHNYEYNYSPTPRWKLSRRRAGAKRIQHQRLCDYCPIAFSNEAHLEKHIKHHHAEVIDSIEFITPDPEFQGTEQTSIKLENNHTELNCIKLENEETADNF
ncbi:histone-lysine N-methyltransferase PRDM9 isoform X2 [Drosophila gunungcola]|uniref:histone-lysine N-methyltransferase PRDM9 isoform X2 n=1 Tax=Drosophila gunungcola TaxID=103775 RepID=UPI0022E5BC48|nr:histone-lysine N-methyltransferase PRDM9 isoform X2 [Drosophila gunungcola]